MVGRGISLQWAYYITEPRPRAPETGPTMYENKRIGFLFVLPFVLGGLVLFFQYQFSQQIEEELVHGEMMMRVAAQLHKAPIPAARGKPEVTIMTLIDTIEPILSVDTAYNLEAAIANYEAFVQANGNWDEPTRETFSLKLGDGRGVDRPLSALVRK